MNKKSTLIALFFMALIGSVNVYAVQGVLSANVLRTLIDANFFGGCMAFLDRNINTATNAPNCPSKWVTFSCSGIFTSAQVGYRMLDQAQLAKATGRPVLVVVDDSKTHNGFCFARRIDVN